MEEQYLTVEEVAGLLNRSVATVWRTLRRYGITTFRKPMDRRAYVKKADLDRLLATYQPSEKAS